MRSGTEHARDLLRRHFGFSTFRPGQERLVTAALANRDTLGVLPTGGGKSLCYQVPALALPGVTLVLSPLISLMEDQTQRAHAVGISAAYLTSALDREGRREVLRRAVQGELRLLFVAPERLDTGEFQDALSRIDLSLVAVDEAHCISEWGHDFRPSYRRIGLLRRTLGAPFMALTATATPEVREDIVHVLGLRHPVRVTGSFDRPNLSWYIRRADGYKKKVVALQTLVRSERGSIVVYAGTRRVVESVRAGLARLGVGVTAYHGGLESGVRSRAQDDFLAGRTRVVVATNAFGMGVDKSDVRLVIHYQLPGTLESYYQEAGRAGRDGQPARCIALHGVRDHRLHQAFIDRARPSVRTLRRVYRTVRGAVGAGGHGLLDIERVARRIKASTEETMDVLVGLERLGVLRISPEGSESVVPGTNAPTIEAGSTPREVRRVSVHPKGPDWSTSRRLRKAALKGLGAVRAYVESDGCRRTSLLAYFGDAPVACGGCDRCDDGSRRGWKRIFG